MAGAGAIGAPAAPIVSTGGPSWPCLSATPLRGATGGGCVNLPAARGLAIEYPGFLLRPWSVGRSDRDGAMTQWLVFALMTAAAVFVVLWPLGRRNAAQMSGSDVAVYQDQLHEIVRDRQAGLIGEREGEAARGAGARRVS